jgi:hypothetical protein
VFPTITAVVLHSGVLQEGGRGIADVLFGRVNPSGRLPITWYHNNYTARVSPLDLRMRPDGNSGYPGRSYRCVCRVCYLHLRLLNYCSNAGHTHTHSTQLPSGVAYRQELYVCC